MPIAFSTVDWSIVAVYLLIATVPGFLCRRYVRGQEDFLLAGRTLSVYLAVATLTATEMGLVTVMYMAEMGFRNGFSGMILGLIAVVTSGFVGLTGFMVSGLRASGVTTVAEYYEKRYSRGVRILGGVIIATAGILNYGVFLRVEADFVRLITQMHDLTLSAGWLGDAPVVVPSIKLAMVILVTLVLVYTLLGGMVSVVLTDYVQFIVLSAGMAATTWWVLTTPLVGGLQGMAAAVNTYRPDYGMNPFVTAKEGALGIGVAWIIWQLMHWTATSNWQTQAFRTAATDSPRTARIMWVLTGVNYFGRAIIPMLWGVAGLAFVAAKGAEAVANADSLQAMPSLLTHLPAGLVGFMLAGMLAALMSTHSSYLLAWSGVLTQDVVAPVLELLGVTLPASLRIWITRFFILCLAAFLLWYGLWFKASGAIWNYLSMTGTMYLSGAAALVALGLYWKRANVTGAYCAILGGALPGLTYLTLRMASLVIEPAIRDAGYVPQTAIARMSAALTETWTGILSFPLAALGMVVGSLWAEGRRDQATGPRIGTGSFMAGGGA
ncbi:MAG: sodium:solute symporter family protein [Phycisphaerae bacterium]|nr:sodium:solute symporter family protein [Phycisphaerae bacterium]